MLNKLNKKLSRKFSLYSFNHVTHLTHLTHFLILGFIILSFCITVSAQEKENKYTAQYLYTIENAGTKYNTFNTPSDISFDPNSNEIYVVDLGTKRVLSLDTNGVVTHEWKNFGKLQNPGSVAIDSRGNLYVGDIAEPEIVVLNYFGKVNRYLDLTSMVTTGSNNIRIHKLAVDKQDQLYIGDNQNNRIIVVDLFNDTVICELTGVPKSETAVTSITDMVFDAQGNLEVLDGGQNRIMVLTPVGELIRSFGISGGTKYTLGMASGISYDPQRKWTLVTDATRHYVLVYDQYGECIYEFGGLGKRPGSFYFPRGITVDSNQHIYVLEPDMNRIQVFNVKKDYTE